MFTAKNRAQLVNALVALWATKRSPQMKPAMATLVNPVHPERMLCRAGGNVNRAGRSLTEADFNRLEQANDLRGGDSDVQFGLLGSFRGVGLFGKPPG